jgi:hypothetical protein
MIIMAFFYLFQPIVNTPTVPSPSNSNTAPSPFSLGDVQLLLGSKQINFLTFTCPLALLREIRDSFLLLNLYDQDERCSQ